MHRVHESKNAALQEMRLCTCDSSYKEIKDFYRELKDSMPANYSHSEIYQMDTTYHNPGFANVTAFWKMYDTNGDEIDDGISVFVLRNLEKRFKIVMVDD